MRASLWSRILRHMGRGLRIGLVFLPCLVIALSMQGCDPLLTASVTACDETSLRNTIDNASDGATIDVSPPSACTIHLTSPLQITKNLTLRMPGPAVTLDGGGSVQVFWVHGGSFTFNLQGFTIAHGLSGTLGGGLENQGQTVTVSNSVFTDNMVTGDGAPTVPHGGGAIGNWGGKVTITNSHFTGNTAAGAGASGGAVFSAPTSYTGALTITGSEFQNNSVTGSGNQSYGGGAVFMERGVLTIKDSRFTGNAATGTYAAGGAVYSNADETTLDSSQFTSNRAQFDGGGFALYQTGYDDHITNATFDNNTAAEGDGGGLCLILDAAANVSLSGATFTHNQAPHGRGGALFHNGWIESGIPPTLNIDQSTFTDNVAARGGGIGLAAARVTIQRSTIANNVASGDAAHPLAVGPQIGGGGISADQFSYDVVQLTLTNSTIWGNKAPYLGGGAIAGSALQLTLANTTVAGNTAAEGGGIALYVGEVAGFGAGKINAKGSIVAANESSNSMAVNCYLLDPGSVVTDAYSLEGGTDCHFIHPGSLRGADPLLDPAGLRDNGGPTQTVMPQPGSPAINSLTNSSLLCPPSDQRGQPRPDDPAEKTCDMGAVETNY